MFMWLYIHVDIPLLMLPVCWGGEYSPLQHTGNITPSYASSEVSFRNVEGGQSFLQAFLRVQAKAFHANAAA